MRGAIQPNHMAVNKYTFAVAGIPVPLTVINISGLEEELQTVDLPDRTRASGGNTGPQEITITMPAHHTVEQMAMEGWWRESQGVLPTYKKIATIQVQRIGPGSRRNVQCIGVFPSKRKESDLEMANDGEMATVEWTLSIDQTIITNL